MLIKRIIAQCPKNSKHLCQDFNLTQDQLKKVFLLPHEVAFEPYLKAFQYKVLNSIIFTNKKLCKIGYIRDDKCSLCKTESESLYHILFECRHTKQFWKEFQYYYYTLTREFVCVWPYETLLQENYIQIALYWIIWYLSLNYTYGVVEKIRLFQSQLPFHPRLKLSMKQKSTYSVKTNKIEKFNKKWALPLDSVP